MLLAGTIIGTLLRSQTNSFLSLDVDEDGLDPPDQHWTPEMLATAQRLILQMQNARIEQFINEPTLDVYTNIVTESLKPSLIKYIRNDITRNHQRSHLETLSKYSRETD